MIKQILIVIFLILITVSAAFSQTTEQQITKIRAVYAEINKRIEDGAKDKTSGFHYALWTIGGKGDNQPWSAVGTMESRDEIWFEGGDAGAGEEGEKAVIRKVVSTYQGAADLHSRNEYFFDEEGALVFVFSSSDIESENGKMIERRFYYANGKVLRIVRDGKSTDAKFSAEDAEKAQEENESANQMQKRYAALIGE